jgi:hypothetical protein
VPANRRWPEQRCTSCEEHDLPCGPNVHARHSATTTKLENNPGSWCVVPDRAESQTTAPAKTTRWDGIGDFESASSLTDLDAQKWDFPLDPTNELLQDCALNLPLQKTKHHTESWAGMTVDLSQNEDALRENKSNLSGPVIPVILDDHREIDQGFVACQAWNG